MRAFAKLFARFTVRPMLRDRFRTAVTVLGIALGVAVVVAIRIANQGSLESFRVATQSIVGQTDLQIVHPAGPIREELLEPLISLNQIGVLSAVVDGYAMLDSEAHPQASGGEYLHVLGVDLIRDRSMRTYQVLRTGDEEQPTTRELLKLLVAPDSVFVPEKLAVRLRLQIGSTLHLIVDSKPRTLTVRGLLLDEGPARTLDGNLAVLDIANAQVLLNRVGLVDRVDVRLHDEVKLANAEAAIGESLTPPLQVRKPAATFGETEKMIAAFQFNLACLSGVALLVGLFLIYNSLVVAVIARRQEIGMLRALGASRGTIMALFIGYAVVCATLGTAVGLVLGSLLGKSAVAATTSTLETFYVATAAAESAQAARMSLSDIAVAFAMTLALSIVAALLPARQAAAVQPVEAIRGGERIRSNRGPGWLAAAAAMLLAVLGVVGAQLPPVDGLPFFGYLSALAFVLAAVFATPHVLSIVCRLFEKCVVPLMRRWRVDAMLAAANLRGTADKIAVSVGALAVALAMMISICMMVESFRQTVVYWIDQTLSADLFVRSLARRSAFTDDSVPDEVVERLARLPFVAAVDSLATRQVDLDGRPVTLAVTDMRNAADYGRLLLKESANADPIRSCVAMDRVLLSEPFALRSQTQTGAEVVLDTDAGPVPFTIAGVYYDYANTQGTILMDQQTYQRHYQHVMSPVSVVLYLQPGVDPDAARKEILDDIGRDFRLYVATQQGLRKEVLRIFDSTFTVTNALQIIAMIVGCAGVIAALITAIYDRRKEIAMLRFTGASSAQIRRMIVFEALLVGVSSQLIGIALGVILSLLLIFVINVQSFGWTIQVYPPIGFIAQSTALVLLASIIAALFPAARAAGLHAVQYMTEE